MQENKVPPLPNRAAAKWHAETAQTALDILDTNSHGLNERAVVTRRTVYGENALPTKRPPSILNRLFTQLRSPLTLVLVGAFFLTLFFKEFLDAIVIGVALLIAVGVGLLQEGRASRAFVTLTESQVDTAQVVREEQRFQVKATDLVPGDIVFIEAGMQVPADIRLLTVKNFSVNEAALTGEWQAVAKQVAPVLIGAPLAERTNMAYRGTYAASGYATGVVVEIGEQTAIGSLASKLQLIHSDETPLQREVRRLSLYMLYGILTIIMVLFGIGIWQGQSVEEMLLLSIAIAVASVPEGLPAALTIILAVGMEALLKRGGLVRNLLAAETLGSTTYVLTDKTGTLTYGRMAVAGILQGGQKISFTDSAMNETVSRDLVETALYAGNAFFDPKQKVVQGDPVEAAVYKLADHLGIVAPDWQSARTDFLPFSSETRFALGIIQAGDAYQLCVTGAPSTVLEAAAQYIDEAGAVQPLTDAIRTEILDSLRAETTAGSRLIAVARKTVLFHDIPANPIPLVSELTFQGLLILSDPVRTDVAAAIAGVEAAGAHILLVTGDNAETARTIAKQAGITIRNDRVITGPELESMSSPEILSAIKAGVTVFARVLPQQKLRLTHILQRAGEIVAMTGDGINDALALQKANIGVAVGSGTEVAKEAADLVLVDDSFAVMYAAIEEGRRIVANIKKVVGYLLSTAMSEVVLIGAALVTGGATPLTAAQILWSNIVEEGFMGAAFAFEKGDPTAMRQRPQDIHKEGILSRDMLLFMMFSVFVLSSLSLALYFYLRLVLQVPFEELRSAMFLSISMDSLFMAFAFRSLTTPLWKIPLTTNLFFLGATIFNVVLLLVVLSVPALRELLSYQPLPLYDIILVFAFSLASLTTIEVGKWLFFERRVKMVE